MPYKVIAACGALLLALTSVWALHVDHPERANSGPRLAAKLEHLFVAGDSPGRQPCFSSDGALLALPKAAGGIYVLRTSDWSLLARFRHPGGATSAAFSPDARARFTAGYDGLVRSCDIAGKRP